MKDEIKEILQLIGSCCYYGSISEDKREKYCNCITNLQEELDRCVKANVILDDENPELQGKITNLQEEYEKEHYLVDKLTRQLTDEYKNTEYQCKQKEDYKSRNEKAIDNIDLVIELIKQQPTEDDTWILNRLNGFKYILQGSDKDDK